MQVAQTRSRKSKATAKRTGGRSVMAVRKPSAGDAESCPAPVTGISAEERQQLIARAAYFRAEKRGFSPCWDQQDWFDAETEVARLIGGR